MPARVARPRPLLLLGLLCACDPGEGRPADVDEPDWRADPTDYGGEEGPPIDEPPMQAPDFLAAVAAESPPADRYDFLGYVKLEGSGYWIHDVEPSESILDLLDKHGIDPTDPDQGIVNPPIASKDHDAGRMIAVSADGRLFLEREDAFRARLLAVKAMPKASLSVLDGEPTPPPDDGSESDADRPDFRDGIWLTDTRDRVTNPSDYPWRAVGVQMFKHTGDDEWSVSTWKRWGSGTMIGPRTLLTAAHVVLEQESSDDLQVMAAAPGAYGASFNGDGDPGPGYASNAKFSWGIRRAVWYMWPLGHYAWKEYKFDYAAVVLEDLGWSPGFIRFGQNSATWLDYRHYNKAGFPQATESCGDSPFGAWGECNGWMYHIYDEVRGVWSYTADHRLDTQNGESGTGIYVYRANTGDRVEYFINVAGNTGATDGGLGKRLREGSFNSICNTVKDFPSSFWPDQAGC